MKNLGVSRPPRARGLKHSPTPQSAYKRASRPPRARGLKRLSDEPQGDVVNVAPPAGAWIETKKSLPLQIIELSRAPRGRVD